ncbi:hypothetical protein BUALT_Bualt02G0065800 [Buddleja alternifolia]|uniref:Uncharacterized protein n=1 Tax=Buddleja alternifolia TaxID=168488 RepID=A0AAV6XY33_9LAMI|nr:hypothetical protein BUALT_Bualt02G0065800 [Buddleja alternifolia]
MGTLSRCDPRNGFQFSHSNLVSECSSIYDHRFADVPGIQGAANLPEDEETTPAVACDYFGGVYEYIKQMLMEEDDLEHRPCMFQDCSALQAAEKYFYDALSEKGSSAAAAAPPLDLNVSAPQEFAVDNHPDLSRSTAGFAQWSLLDSQICGGFSCDFDRLLEASPEVLNSTANSRPISEIGNGSNQSLNRGKENSREDPGRKKGRDRGENGDSVDEPNNKHLACVTEESSEQTEQYDKSLLCPMMNPRFYDSSPCRCEEVSDDNEDEDEDKKQYRKSTEVKRGRPKGSKKNRKVRELVDLRGLLTRCAQAVSGFNTKSAEELLKQIRQHSSPYGDANERLAHCFANALEARMAGTGSALYTAVASRHIPASELLKSYQSYITACPFKRMSNIFANKSIARETREADKIHIIDFGILYGFQWPCIIQGLSLKPGGPPMLKITGIDFPQPGFKPAERVEQTGRRLVNYCKRFNVPFEYNAIAKKWDDICIDDLKIQPDEMVVVNCLYRMRHVPDESAGVNSPRDAVLRLIATIKPHLFVHGVVNGTYNATFFETRFRETLYHYSSLFDMMEATLQREDQDRLLYEREVFGRDVMNVIACEGYERVERPETYKQWQVRNQRVGFTQIPLNREILKEVKTKLWKGYHNEFLLDEDGEWMLQGWKGRVMYALSCWKPLQE